MRNADIHALLCSCHFFQVEASVVVRRECEWTAPLVMTCNADYSNKHGCVRCKSAMIPWAKVSLNLGLDSTQCGLTPGSLLMVREGKWRV